ncbi:MAG TPA: DUF4214 domain-containing protein [Iamia sp.]
MHDDQPVGTQPSPSRLTRRHVLVAGAAVGTTVALRGLPAMGAEAEGGTGSASSDTSSTSSTTTTTAPTTTTTPPTTTTTQPAITEPAHPTEERSGGQTRGFDTVLSESPDRGIMFPVFPNSATTWNHNQDTYNACRDGCSRRHQGEDLMAPKMTKLLAVKAGVIVELRHRTTGNSLYIRGDDGWFYCYLHINNDRPGTDDKANRVEHAWGPGLRKFATSATAMNETAARGYRVREGELVAFCGDSGNAEGSGSHLHFEIRKPATGNYSSETTRLWASASVNPRESLRGAKAAREVSMVPPETFRPWTTSTAFITAQYRDFLGRNPSSGDIAYYGEMLDYGTKSPDWLMQYFLESDEGDGKTQCIARLYQAFYKRLPDTAGFMYWMDARRSGSWSLHRIAEQFARAPEFTQMYGSVDNGGFVDLVYDNVLGRDPDPAGRQYWIDQLDAGVTRGKVMTGFSESPEYKAAQRNRMHVVGCYGVMYNRIPTSSELSAWQNHLNGGGSTRDMIVMLRMEDEYTEAAT